MFLSRWVQRLPPRTRVHLAGWLLLVSLAGWPLSIWLTKEPPVILSLSWLALVFTAWDIIQTADVRDSQEG